MALSQICKLVGRREGMKQQIFDHQLVKTNEGVFSEDHLTREACQLMLASVFRLSLKASRGFAANFRGSRCLPQLNRQLRKLLEAWPRSQSNTCHDNGSRHSQTNEQLFYNMDEEKLKNSCICSTFLVAITAIVAVIWTPAFKRKARVVKS